MIVEMEKATEKEICKVVCEIKSQGFDVLLKNGKAIIVIVVLGCGIKSFDTSEIVKMPSVIKVTETECPLGDDFGKFLEWQYFCVKRK